MLYNSHSPIKAALTERLMRTIRLLSSRYCKLTNNVAFTQDLDKIIQIYCQRLHLRLSNISPQEVHRGYHNTLDTFLKQYSSERVMKRK